MHLHDNRKCSAIFCNFANCSTQLIYCLSKCITPKCRGKLSSWYSRLMYLMAKLEVIGSAVIPSGGKCNQNLWSCYTITNKTFPELMMVCGLCAQCLHRSLSREARNNKKVEMKNTDYISSHSNVSSYFGWVALSRNSTCVQYFLLYLMKSWCVFQMRCSYKLRVQIAIVLGVVAV